jgi:hypothetical protein
VTDHVLIIGGPRHGERTPYLSERMALPDTAPVDEPDDAAAYRLADETPQAMTVYLVRKLYVSGKDTPGQPVKVASPASMAEDEVYDLLAGWMEERSTDRE